MRVRHRHGTARQGRARQDIAVVRSVRARCVSCLVGCCRQTFCSPHLLLVVERPRDLVVVSGAEVDHDVLVAEEKHDGARVV